MLPRIVRTSAGQGIVGTAGDNVLAEFPSSIEAVRCAVEIQEALNTRKDTLSEDRRLVFRIGVNLGDVMVKDGYLLGDGVNIAARLETMAEAGGICISSSVYDQIAGKLNLVFADLGYQPLKNITRPVHVYRVPGTSAVVRTARFRSRRRSAAWTIGGVAFAVVAVMVAWHVGWLTLGARDSERRSAQNDTKAEEQQRAVAERTRVRPSSAGRAHPPRRKPVITLTGHAGLLPATRRA